MKNLFKKLTNKNKIKNKLTKKKKKKKKKTSDQTPDGDSHDSYGHTKGVCGFDESTGFWLVHSVPRWPNAPPSTYSFPDYEKDNGQSFLCMTFSSVLLLFIFIFFFFIIIYLFLFYLQN